MLVVITEKIEGYKVVTFDSCDRLYGEGVYCNEQRTGA